MRSTDQLKKKAGEYAAEQFIQSGMLVGLGVGSTAIHAVRKISQLIKEGKIFSITAIACSLETEEYAGSLGIPLIDINPETKIDLTIDGADEVDPDLNLIKGGGGALTREKIVAQISRREIIVIDQTKHSDILGTNWAVPVEVIPFGWQSQDQFLQSLGARTKLRTLENGNAYLTDQRNYIIDADFGPIHEPIILADQMKHRTGIVEHGLFINLATDLIIATEDGIIHKNHES
jgi:ribose 5-phosphate isomerase A